MDWEKDKKWRWKNLGSSEVSKNKVKRYDGRNGRRKENEDRRRCKDKIGNDEVKEDDEIDIVN